MLAALRGAFLSIGFVGTFTENMTAGRGYIALAAVIFGKWLPGWAFAATLLFGFGFRHLHPLQREAGISENLISTLPHAHARRSRRLVGRSIPPAAVGRPYVKGRLRPRAEHEGRLGAGDGLLALAALAGAVFAARHYGEVRLMHAVIAVPLAFGFSLAAVILGRQARQEHQRTLGRSGSRASSASSGPRRFAFVRSDSGARPGRFAVLVLVFELAAGG